MWHPTTVPPAQLATGKPMPRQFNPIETLFSQGNNRSQLIAQQRAASPEFASPRGWTEPRHGDSQIAFSPQGGRSAGGYGGHSSFGNFDTVSPSRGRGPSRSVEMDDMDSIPQLPSEERRRFRPTSGEWVSPRKFEDPYAPSPPDPSSYRSQPPPAIMGGGARRDTSAYRTLGPRFL